MMEKETFDLSFELAQNPDLAMQISKAVSKFQLKAPAGKVVVWVPVLADKPLTLLEAHKLLINGIPAPDYLNAAIRFREQFGI